MKSKEIKPQDIVIIVKLSTSRAAENIPRQIDLSKELSMSQSEISEGLQRLKYARLLDSKRQPIKPSVVEVLVHGVKYFFAANPKEIIRGIPTAYSHPTISKKFKNIAEKVVWPFSEGKIRGMSIEPLYKSVPSAALKDEELYYILALVDLVRIGRRREVDFATKEIKNILG